MQSGKEELKSLRWDTLLQCLDNSVIDVLGYHFVREIIGFIPICSLQTLFLKAIIRASMIMKAVMHSIRKILQFIYLNWGLQKYSEN